MKKLLLLSMLLIVGCENNNEPIIIDGYLNQMSYFPDDHAKVYINSREECTDCQLGIFDINQNLVFKINANFYSQKISSDNPSVNGYDYELTTEFIIPKLSSGIYLIANKIPFIIKTRENVTASIIYPSNTSNAYNVYYCIKIIFKDES